MLSNALCHLVPSKLVMYDFFIEFMVWFSLKPSWELGMWWRECLVRDGVTDLLTHWIKLAQICETNWIQEKSNFKEFFHYSPSFMWEIYKNHATPKEIPVKTRTSLLNLISDAKSILLLKRVTSMDFFKLVPLAKWQ